MLREHLEELPQFTLPPGFHIRFYRAGEAKVWTSIQVQTEKYREITPAFHEQQFGNDQARLQARQMFLGAPEGSEIGTGTAWFDPTFAGGNCGRVHWLAIVPEYQGKGLGKALLSAVCHRLRELGHTCATLRTQTARVAAIHLYLKFGFKPDIKCAEDLAAWEALKAQGLPVPL
jgi:GNAT superfamily N-acetyltransferase